MAESRTIAVVGGTGAQGGGLVRAMLDDPSTGLRPRVLTRDPHSAKASVLAGRGADVVQADLDDVQSLCRAFEGAWGAYCVTNFWEHFSPERELQQARNMAQAAKTAGLRHVVWSTLDDTRRRVPLDDTRMPTLMGKYKVPHLDAKGEADAFFTEAGLPTTFFMAAFYWDNFIHFGMGPQRGSDGVLAITLPMGDRKLPGIAAEDIGRCALGVFKAGEACIGRRVGVSGEQLTGEQMAATFSRVLGQEVRYNAVPPKVYASFGFPGADDLANMFQYKHDFNDEFCATMSAVEGRRLNPAIQTFEQWLRANKDRIPVP